MYCSGPCILIAARNTERRTMIYIEIIAARSIKTVKLEDLSKSVNGSLTYKGRWQQSAACEGNVTTAQNIIGQSYQYCS